MDYFVPNKLMRIFDEFRRDVRKGKFGISTQSQIG